MIVVADTSPLNYLIQIECESILPRIYGQIVVPATVAEELGHAGAPASVRHWLAAGPAWLQIRQVSRQLDPQLQHLGPGERQAIQIYSDLNADLLLIDERKGRLEAMRRGLRTTGTLGVLLSAAELGFLDPQLTYRRLVAETNFRVAPDLEAQFLALIRHQ